MANSKTASFVIGEFSKRANGFSIVIGEFSKQANDFSIVIGEFISGGRV